MVKAAGDLGESCLKDVLMAELEVVSNAINERDKHSNTIKQWCLTIWSGTWLAAGLQHWEQFIHATVVEYRGLLIACASTALCAMFFVLDLTNKRNQYKFLWRSRVLQQFINLEPDLDPAPRWLE